MNRARTLPAARRARGGAPGPPWRSARPAARARRRAPSRCSGWCRGRPSLPELPVDAALATNLCLERLGLRPPQGSGEEGEVPAGQGLCGAFGERLERDPVDALAGGRCPRPQRAIELPGNPAQRVLDACLLDHAGSVGTGMQASKRLRCVLRRVLLERRAGAHQVAIAEGVTLEGRVKDPRLGFVTITDVRVTGDLQQASIFYTVLGDEDAQSGTAAALASAKGLIRREVGSALGLRITPSIEFFADGLQESVSAMNDLMSSVRAADAELAKLRENAKPAGDADPYKVTE